MSRMSSCAGALDLSPRIHARSVYVSPVLTESTGRYACAAPPRNTWHWSRREAFPVCAMSASHDSVVTSSPYEFATHPSGGPPCFPDSMPGFPASSCGWHQALGTATNRHASTRGANRVRALRAGGDRRGLTAW